MPAERISRGLVPERRNRSTHFALRCPAPFRYSPDGITVTARSGQVIAIEGRHISQIIKTKRMTTQKPRVIHIPESHKLPFPSSKCPLKLFAYHIAIRRGCDVGQPGNLAKSVTVE